MTTFDMIHTTLGIVAVGGLIATGVLKGIIHKKVYGGDNTKETLQNYIEGETLRKIKQLNKSREDEGSFFG